MIDQLTIFVKGFPDARVYSSVILVYCVTIRWLHFTHAQSICTRPPDHKDVWPGNESIKAIDNTIFMYNNVLVC